MDLIHSFSKLESETQHPYSSSSSSQKEVEELEVKRNWFELPADVMSLIFLKLGYIDILVSAQWVCSSWWNLSKQPHLFRSIHADHVDKVPYLFDHFRSSCSSSLLNDKELSRGMVREAIDRSCGQLVEFSIGPFATDELLRYMYEKSSSLRCLRLESCFNVSVGGLIEMTKKLPQLEELEIIDGLFMVKEVFETFRRFSPLLKSCRLYYPISFTETERGRGLDLTIVPKLSSLNVLSFNLQEDDGLKAVLSGP